MLTNRSSIGDDVSVAGLIDPQAQDTAPVLGRTQKLQEVERLSARLEELNSTIGYHQQQLWQTYRSGSEETRQQLESALRRDQAAADQLNGEIDALRRSLQLATEGPTATDTTSDSEIGLSETDEDNSTDLLFDPETDDDFESPFETEKSGPAKNRGTEEKKDADDGKPKSAQEPDDEKFPLRNKEIKKETHKTNHLKKIIHNRFNNKK